MSISLAVPEDLIDGSGVAARIEVLLPVGVRHRQLAVRTLILGMLLTLDGRRPAFLTEAHALRRYTEESELHRRELLVDA